MKTENLTESSQCSDAASAATAAFHRPPENFNCAQAVASALGADESVVAADSANGGGRAEGGLCGALFAALRAVPPERREEVKSSFAKETGALACREIKGTFKTPCHLCVAAAARLAADAKQLG